MRRIFSALLLSLSLSMSFVVTSADHPQINRESDNFAVQNVYKIWNAAVEAGDREGYLSILDDDIRMVPSGAPDIYGIEAYAEFLISVFANAQYKITHLSEHDVEFISRDTAVVRYDYIIDVTLGQGVEVITDSKAALDQLTNNIKYQDILRRQEDGSWKVLRHMWNDGYAR